jgi:hypothetical protein
MIASFLLLAALAGAAAVAAWVRTPDYDRPRVYPREPDRWAGITGKPAPFRHALGTLLFWAVALFGVGIGGAMVESVAPGESALALAGGAVLGVVLAVWTARRMLRAGPGAMRMMPALRKAPVGRVPRVLFVCGSPNQTGQMLQIARALPEVEAWFTPYYSDSPHYVATLKVGLFEPAIHGHKRRGICVDELNRLGLRIDLAAERNAYDLWVCPNDAIIPSGVSRVPWVLVQEGIMEQPNWRTWVWRYTRLMPRGIATTAVFGLTKRYEKFCVASEGYRKQFLAEGIPADKLVVTGIPNFDDFARFRDNDFPHHGYVLVCTSDGRETMMKVDRPALLARSVEMAAGRQLIFKLHPNENVERATREILAIAPSALVFADGNAEEMVANCDVLITEHSSLTFCGLALGKEVHTNLPLEQVEALLPVQNRRAAEEIADVIRGVLRARGRVPQVGTGAQRIAS